MDSARRSSRDKRVRPTLTILDVADAYVLLSPFAARYAVEPSPKEAAFDTTNVSLGMAA